MGLPGRIGGEELETANRTIVWRSGIVAGRGFGIKGFVVWFHVLCFFLVSQEKSQDLCHRVWASREGGKLMWERGEDFCSKHRRFFPNNCRKGSVWAVAGCGWRQWVRTGGVDGLFWGPPLSWKPGSGWECVWGGGWVEELQGSRAHREADGAASRAPWLRSVVVLLAQWSVLIPCEWYHCTSPESPTPLWFSNKPLLFG